MNTENRLKKEYELFKTDPPCNCSGGPITFNNKLNFFQWNAIITGPEATPYANGIFSLQINFPPNYPFKPPQLFFKTPIYHPNISKNGAICLDILKEKWSPALTISKVLLSICSLLSDPNPMDPLRPELAKLYLENKIQYQINVREHTLLYST
tara:strand:- start:401 stop:859 length:459 start_codon:yes stop_codon:yes gene_type:complete